VFRVRNRGAGSSTSPLCKPVRPDRPSLMGVARKWNLRWAGASCCSCCSPACPPVFSIPRQIALFAHASPCAEHLPANAIRLSRGATFWRRSWRGRRTASVVCNVDACVACGTGVQPCDGYLTHVWIRSVWAQTCRRWGGQNPKRRRTVRSMNLSARASAASRVSYPRRLCLGVDVQVRGVARSSFKEWATTWGTY